MPFLLRELVEAVSEGGIGSAVETVGRWFASGSAGSRSMRGGSRERWRFSRRATCSRRRASRASTSRGSRCSRSAGDRGDPRARPAADVRASHRPQRDLFELSSAERALVTAAPLNCSPSNRASARVAQHLLVSEPAGDGWAVERLVEAACTAGKAVAGVGGGLPAPCARRAAAPRSGRRCCSTWEWPRRVRGSPTGPKHLEQAVDTALNAETAGVVALVLGARAQPRPALRGGGHGARSRRDVVRHPDSDLRWRWRPRPSSPR